MYQSSVQRKNLGLGWHSTTQVTKNTENGTLPTLDFKHFPLGHILLDSLHVHACMVS